MKRVWSPDRFGHSLEKRNMPVPEKHEGACAYGASATVLSSVRQHEVWLLMQCQSEFDDIGVVRSRSGYHD